MNKYIENYISLRKKEMEIQKMKEKQSVMDLCGIGEREYRKDFPDEPSENFPYYDSSVFQYYRYNAGEISDDDYTELLKYIPEDKKSISTTSEKKMSGWYGFAIAMIILCCFCGIVGGINAGEKGGLIIILSSILFSLTFFSQIILLSKIEFNTRKK